MTKLEKRNTAFLIKLLQNEQLQFNDVLNHYANFILEPYMLGEIEKNFKNYSLVTYIKEIGWNNFRILITTINYFIDFQQDKENQFDFNKTHSFKERLEDFLKEDFYFKND